MIDRLLMGDKMNHNATSDKFLPAYEFHLYVTGTTPNSLNAINNIREICEQFISGQYELKIIDLYNDPQAARKDQIIAIPTLIRKKPLPEKRIIGDLSDTDKVMDEMDILKMSRL